MGRLERTQAGLGKPDLSVPLPDRHGAIDGLGVEPHHRQRLVGMLEIDAYSQISPPSAAHQHFTDRLQGGIFGRAGCGDFIRLALCFAAATIDDFIAGHSDNLPQNRLP